MDLPQQTDLIKAISDKWKQSNDCNSLTKEFSCTSSEETIAFALALLQLHSDTVLIEATPNTNLGTVVVRTTGKTNHPNSERWIDSLQAIQSCYDKTHRKFNGKSIPPSFNFFKH